jgi:hypothetical protein
VSAGAACPEELEAMLEDACLLGDASLLANLFDVDAILLARGSSQVRGRPALAKAIIDQHRDGGIYVGAPCLVMQSGELVDHLRRCNLGGPAQSGRLALRDQSA